MCGICGFGGSGTPDISTLKVLGILNEERGKDSAGIILLNEIYKKGDKTTFRELMEKLSIDPSKIKGNVFIHTRAATIGGLTKENAHPYYYNKNGKDGMFFMHNGTIDNIDSLVKKYKVNVDGYGTDSQKLGKIIYEKKYEVLNDYLGAAAFAFYYESEPHIIYLWNGAGLDGFQKDENKKEWIEERGLYYTHPKQNCVYFSSQENHLKNAFHNQFDVFQVPINQLIKVDKGKLSVIFKADRSDKYIYHYGTFLPKSENKRTYSGSYNNSSNDSIYHYNLQSTWLYNHAAGALTYNPTYKFLCEFSSDAYFKKNIAYGHIYFNGRRYVDSDNISDFDHKKYADGIFWLTQDGKKQEKNVGKQYFFLDGYLLAGEKEYNKASSLGYLTEQEMVPFLHPESIHIKLNNSRAHYISSLYIESLDADFIGFATALFCPFVFYYRNDVVLGFKIHHVWKEFFRIPEMLACLNKKASYIHIIEKDIVANSKQVKLFKNIVEKFKNLLLTCENKSKNNGTSCGIQSPYGTFPYDDVEIDYDVTTIPNGQLSLLAGGLLTESESDEDSSEEFSDNVIDTSDEVFEDDVLTMKQVLAQVEYASDEIISIVNELSEELRNSYLGTNDSFIQTVINDKLKNIIEASQNLVEEAQIAASM